MLASMAFDHVLSPAFPRRGCSVILYNLPLYAMQYPPIRAPPGTKCTKQKDTENRRSVFPVPYKQTGRTGGTLCLALILPQTTQGSNKKAVSNPHHIAEAHRFLYSIPLTVNRQVDNADFPVLAVVHPRYRIHCPQGVQRGPCSIFVFCCVSYLHFHTGTPFGSF